MTPTFSETQMETDSVQWIDAVLADGEHAARLRSNLPYFAEHALKLRPKSGPLEPFILNPALRFRSTSTKSNKNEWPKRLWRSWRPKSEHRVANLSVKSG